MRSSRFFRTQPGVITPGVWLKQAEAIVRPGPVAGASTRRARCAGSLREWLERAAELIGRAVAADPDDAAAHCNLAIALRRLDRLAQSAAAARQAIRLKPSLAEAYINLGLALTDLGKFDEAIDAYQQALRLQPDNANPWRCLGTTLSDAGRLDESMAAHRRAIALMPDLAGAHFNLGGVLLLAGDFRGWAEYEWRWKYESFTSLRRVLVLWLGQPIGEGVLLLAEQGFGDTIHFVRFAGEVAARGARVILECQPELVSLFKTLPGIHSIVEKGRPLPAFDVQCPLLTLPLALGITWGSVS